MTSNNYSNFPSLAFERQIFTNNCKHCKITSISELGLKKIQTITARFVDEFRPRSSGRQSKDLGFIKGSGCLA
jgi:hypothetical protein